ncbi:hypothetical protein [uncultured Cellulomonas sp.]|uniref:hypothetical protein n=1 Tax=uncultured Cellulomonas sp. TaxID=189682 RepID=UPI002607F272|nr:hypothetical protein [uncultured Cellulomonas sp.]
MTRNTAPSAPDEFTEALPPESCLTAGPDCQGPVEYRTPLSGTGTPFPRCDHHWEGRLDLEHQLRERYPSTAPADFDPAYAGETWDGDDW